MVGSVAPPWRTTVLDGGQSEGALDLAVEPFSGVGSSEDFEPGVGEPAAIVLGEVAGAGLQFDALTFFLRTGCWPGAGFFAAGGAGEACFDAGEGFGSCAVP